MEDISLDPMTDREMLIATFNAVAALAKRLTGDQIVVQTQRDGDHSILMHGSTYAVRWNSKAAL